MNHLVGKQPVGPEIQRRCICAHMNWDQPAAFSERHSIPEAPPLDGSDPNYNTRCGKAPVVGRYGLGGRTNPIQQAIPENAGWSFLDDNVDLGFADQNG